MSKVEEVAEPGPNSEEASVTDGAGDPRQTFPGEGARLLRHDPRGALETARSLDTHVIRPSSIDRRNRQDDRQICHRIEVSLRGDHEDRAVTALLSAANRLAQATTPGASSRSVTWQVGEFCELPRLRLLGVRRAVFDRGRRDCLFERCHAIAAVRGIREYCEVCTECQTRA